MLAACAGSRVFAAEAPAAEPENAVLAVVIVTGSRIPVGAVGGTTPLTVLDADDIRRGALDSLGRVLQTLPFNTGSPMNTNVNNEGDGSERLDLRGLGPKRTLILLNGRRFPNGGLGGNDSVDASMIPLSLVERVEVLTSGASAIYGADAVAGVINVITRKSAPGVEINLKTSLTEQGDGRISTGQLVAGREFAGGAWSLGADFVHQEPVRQSERGYSALPMLIDSADGTHRLGGTAAIPDGLFALPPGNAFHLDPDLYVRIPGATGQTAADYRLRQASDVFFRSPYTYLQTPNEHGTLWLLGSQPLTDNVTLFAEGLWHERRSAQQSSPVPIISGLSPLPTLSNGSTGIPADNWYNPFGVDIEGVERRLIELPNRGFEQRIEAWRALIGARGAWHGWHWEIAAGTAESKGQSTEKGLPSALRLIPALGPSGPDAGGRIVCGARDPASGIVPAAKVVAGCVPLNLFGGAGTITREQIDYIDVTLLDQGSGSNRLMDFSAEGPWGQLPAGPLRWALGAEYRHEGGSFHLDPLRRAGVTGEEIPTDLQGASFEAREVYLEARVPLLKDSFAARTLDLALGVRHSKFSSFGAHSTWQAGVRWQPVEPWSFRASYAQVFRAPDLGELFESAILHRVQGGDPCGTDPTPVQRTNCRANGVPGGAYQQDPSVEWNVQTGGNRDLFPEHGVSFDAGIELRPPSLPDLQMSIDYFHVNLEGFIEVPGPDDELLECANRGTPAACELIHRAIDGTLRQVDAPYRNLGGLVASGYDLAADFGFEAGKARLSLGALATYLAQRDSEFLRGQAPLRLAGQQGFPHWRANAHIDAAWPVWRVGYSLQFIGEQSQCGYDFGCAPVASVLYHDLEGSLTLAHAVELRAGVLNLTDRDPPYVDGGGPNTDTAAYRLLGRTYFAEVNYHF
jgi:outer membrane receptor protein involved in Fe transport